MCLPMAHKQRCAGRIWPVHRLDTPTSGLVLFAKSPEAAGALVAAFRDKQVAKYYVALSGGGYT
jgi:23S rRNA-/tRNA-specific pseudouridylate synthase